MVAPAYLIVTERLRVRCWASADAHLLQSAILESLEHLRPAMPWAQLEPQTLEFRVDLLRSFRARMDRGDDAVYGIFDPREETVLGGTGLHRHGDDGAREIGYWIHVAHVGRGYATVGTRLL
jgi:RimJ/RimL family protein N-acetyltransferase